MQLITNPDGRTAVTGEEAWTLASHWVAAWNAHDLDLIMSHYGEAMELTSPLAAQLLGTREGKVVGKANWRAYFERGLEAYPDLRFQLEDVLWGVHSVVLYYTNQKGTRAGEFMELSATGKLLASWLTTGRSRGIARQKQMGIPERQSGSCSG